MSDKDTDHLLGELQATRAEVDRLTIGIVDGTRRKFQG
jgi:hypothetical protein